VGYLPYIYESADLGQRRIPEAYQANTLFEGRRGDVQDFHGWVELLGLKIIAISGMI
jgi:hypothetical protein